MPNKTLRTTLIELEALLVKMAMGNKIDNDGVDVIMKAVSCIDTLERIDDDLNDHISDQYRVKAIENNMMALYRRLM